MRVGAADPAMGKRLFVSVDCDPLADAIREAQEPLADLAGVRVTDPEQVHVTLKFLGDTPDDRVRAAEECVAAAVDDADVGPFDCHLAGYGVFPSLDYISVVWLGVAEGDMELTRLHRAVERETVAAGFDAYDHDSFTAHATVARMDDARSKREVQDLVRAARTGASDPGELGPRASPDVGTFRAEEVRLTESRLTDDGPVYETAARFPL